MGMWLQWSSICLACVGFWFWFLALQKLNQTILLGLYPEVELLDHMAILFLIIQETVILFFIESASLYIFTKRVQKFQFLLFIFWQTILIGVRWHLLVVSICISLTIRGVKHLFSCLLAICISSLDKCLIHTLCLVLNCTVCLFYC